VLKASRGIEDIYELTYIRKDGSRFPAVVSVTALRDAQDVIIGYLLIGTEACASALTALAKYSSASAFSFRTISASMPAVARRRHSAACSRNFPFSDILFTWKLAIHRKASSLLSTQW
jgi:hypothetical protein